LLAWILRPSAELARAKAQLAQAEGYEKVRTGSRSEEINIARAKVAAAQAQADLNRERAERYRSLAQKGPLLKTNLMKFSAAIAAPAPVYEAQQQLQQLTTGSRSEDIKSAAAQWCRLLVALAQTQVDDTIIRAPFAGIVTQKYATVGAIVTPTTSASSTASATSTSIVALASELEIK